MTTYSADSILALLAAPSDSYIDTKRRICEEAEGGALLEALARAQDERVVAILCDILGQRHQASAVPELAGLLVAGSPRVRAAAADALAKIGDPNAGEPLMKRLEEEPSIEVRQMLVAALGAVRHAPAIPLLLETVRSPEPVIRGASAWALGELGAREALPLLEELYAKERLPYPRTRLREALLQLRALPKGTT
jgi:HEAT repeat protein